MATFLDISILGNFVSIFTFLLVFALVMGFLSVFKAFGGEERRGLHAIIALAVGVMVIFTKNILVVIQTFVPYFTLIIILFFFIIFANRMFGASQEEVAEDFYRKGSISLWIMIFTVLIALVSLSKGFGQQLLEEGTGLNGTTNGTTVQAAPGPGTTTGTQSFSQNVSNTLFHPKVLGLLLIMLICVIACVFLTTREGP